MSGILEHILAYKREVEVPALLRELPLAGLRRRAEATQPPRDFAGALRAAPRRPALIAEVKRASPSKGLLAPHYDPVALARAYLAHGAAAVSVLTDRPHFQGSLGHLIDVRQALPAAPLLRKDFLVHPAQLYQARAAGADAVLLIAAALDDAELADLHALAGELGMAALIEAHDRAEVERALRLEPALLGVNNRDLRDFHVSLETSLALRSLAPAHTLFVSESGIHTRADVRRLADAGVDAILVGEALVTAPDLPALLRELTDGR